MFDRSLRLMFICYAGLFTWVNVIQAMDTNDLFKDCANSLAQLALNCSGDSRSVEQLSTINESDIHEVSATINPQVETYTATLNDMGSLIADCFLAGPLKGSISCRRRVRDKRGQIISVPIGTHYFHMLKKIAQQTPKDTK